MHSPLPNTPLTLRAILLTSSPPFSEPNLPSIRFRITPHFLVPDCIVSTLTDSYNIGHCVETVVPVGGKVEVGLTVDEESLIECGVLGEGPSSRVTRGVTESFRLNAQLLSLSTVAPVAQSRHDSSTFSLTPLSSTPRNNLLLTHMIPTGHPICYLKRFDVHCSWTMARTGGALKRLPEDDEHEDGQAQEDIIDDLMVSDDHGLAAADQMGPNEEGNGPVELLLEDQHPRNWLDDQIRNACQKLLLKHFLRYVILTFTIYSGSRVYHYIRRFPLIFDGRLAETLPKYTVPSQLISSVSHFALLSTAYDTPLSQKLGEIMEKITRQQQGFLSFKVDQTVNLPARKDRKLEAGRKRRKRLKQITQGINQLDSTQQENEQPENENDATIKINRRKEWYLEQVKASTDTSESRGMGQEERRITRVIGDAIGLICHNDFKMKRNRGGRLSAAGTKFQYPTDDTHPLLPTSDTQPFLISRTSSNAASDTSRDESSIENTLANTMSYEILVDDQEEPPPMRQGNGESFSGQQQDEDDDEGGEFTMDDKVNDDQEDDDLLLIESWPSEGPPETNVIQQDNNQRSLVGLHVERFEDVKVAVDGDNNIGFESLELKATFVD
ncbi:hypothetical protein C343_03755 [Cryptococcus neoformans C23]|nr:hypothetical protein C343_03755 [Cryptococcus neoformans var. grubii C23]